MFTPVHTILKHDLKKFNEIKRDGKKNDDTLRSANNATAATATAVTSAGTTAIFVEKSNGKNLNDLFKAFFRLGLKANLQNASQVNDIAELLEVRSLLRSGVYIANSSADVEFLKKLFKISRMSNLNVVFEWIKEQENHPENFLLGRSFYNQVEEEHIRNALYDLRFKIAIKRTVQDLNDTNAIQYSVSQIVPLNIDIDIFNALILSGVTGNNALLNMLENGISNLFISGNDMELNRLNTVITQGLRYISYHFQKNMLDMIVNAARDGHIHQLNYLIDFEIPADRIIRCFSYSIAKLNPQMCMLLLNKGARVMDLFDIEQLINGQCHNRKDTVIDLLLEAFTKKVCSNYNPDANEKFCLILDILIWVGLAPTVQLRRQHLAEIFGIDLPVAERCLVIPERIKGAKNKLASWDTMDTRMEEYQKVYFSVLAAGFHLAKFMSQLQKDIEKNKLDQIGAGLKNIYDLAVSMKDLVSLYEDGSIDKMRKNKKYREAFINHFIINLQEKEYHLRSKIEHFKFCLTLNDTIKCQAAINRREKCRFLSSIMKPTVANKKAQNAYMSNEVLGIILDYDYFFEYPETTALINHKCVINTQYLIKAENVKQQQLTYSEKPYAKKRS